MDVLELVGNSPEGLTLAQVSRGTGIKKQTAYNILGTLAGKGFLVKELPRKRYRLSDLMGGLRRRQNAWNRNVLMPAVPVAVRLARQLRADVFVYQYVGGGVIARLKAYKEPDMAPAHWYHYPVFAHGTGVLLEAFMDADERRLFRKQHPLSADDVDYWKTYSLLDKFLRIVRRDGYVSFLKGGTFRAAGAVLDSSGRAVAGISAVKEFTTMPPGDQSRCVEAVREAARQLTMRVAERAEPVAVR
jgi:DNA-binding IclR family transcriptional regulator